MEPFVYRRGELYAEDVALAAVAAEVGTPCYVYSRAAVEQRFRAFDTAFRAHDHLVCYAVKANSNLAVLNLLARLGAGFDIVSLGELERVLAAGGEAGRVVFSGVGKGASEIRRALEVGIYCFNVESEAELERLNEIAGEMGRPAPVALRVNPDVPANTHPYIATGLKKSKFGIPIEQARAAYRAAAAMPNLRIQGVACHIGSQITELAPFADAVGRVLELIAALAADGVPLAHVDLGGGLGIRYRDETPPAPVDYAAALIERLHAHAVPLRLLIEPGRAIVGNAGVLLTRIEYLKPGPVRNFAVVDAAMNDLMRPALYKAWHDIVPVRVDERGQRRMYDVVGPVCETSDVLGADRELAVQAGDLLAVRSAGAYGFAMSSNYNTRPRAAEVMVDGARFHVVRRRETVPELMAGEAVLPAS